MSKTRIQFLTILVAHSLALLSTFVFADLLAVLLSVLACFVLEIALFAWMKRFPVHRSQHERQPVDLQYSSLIQAQLVTLMTTFTIATVYSLMTNAQNRFSFLAFCFVVGGAILVLLEWRKQHVHQ